MKTELETTMPIAAALSSWLTRIGPPPPPPSPEVREELEAERDARSRAMVLEARRADNLRRWELTCPMGLQASDWSHPSLAPYRAQIDAVLAHTLGEKGILASGPTGRGKSRAMWQLMRRLGDEGHDVRLYTASDWFTHLQDNLRYGRDDARHFVETSARRRIVFIDDLGQEALTTAREEWAQAWFFRFLDIRVGEKLPLFVTTNLTAKAIAGKNGQLRESPLLRRMLEVADPIRFDPQTSQPQSSTSSQP